MGRGRDSHTALRPHIRNVIARACDMCHATQTCASHAYRKGTPTSQKDREGSDHMTRIELVGCRFDEATTRDLAYVPIRRDWHEDRFSQMLADMGCDGYGHSDDTGPLKAFEVAFEDGDPNAHYVIDTPLFTLRPFYWGDSSDVCALPNFVYKPWSYEISWYKYPLRNAHANFDLKDDDFALMCDTCVRAAPLLPDIDAAGVDDFPRMSEAEEVAWEMRRRLDGAYAKNRELEDLLFEVATAIPIPDSALRSRVMGRLGLEEQDMFEGRNESEGTGA